MPPARRATTAATLARIDGLLDELSSALKSLAKDEQAHTPLHEAGLLPFLVSLAGAKQPESRRVVAAHGMRQLCAPLESAEMCEALIEAGAVPQLVALLLSH